MRRALQVGDRVAVYSGVCRFIRTVAAVRDGCYVDLVVPIANTPEHSMGTVHVRQCRRLIRRERRRVWIWKEYFRGLACEAREAFREIPPEPGDTGFVEFLEARPRKEREK